MRRGQNGRARRLLVESLETRRVLTSLPYGATELDLGEFLLGDVAVTPVFFESVGAASTEDWDDQKEAEVLGKIDEGLGWWETTLATKSTVHELNFIVDTEFADTPFETIYEPISRRSNDYVLYVREFLDSQGFGTGNLERDMRAFNQSRRELHQTDWAFTMVVVPSFNDNDGQFASGGSFPRAFAFAGGLFMVVPSTRPASTFAHELSHIFWGRDEYPGGGSYFQRRGYYNTQNLNAHNNPDPGFVQQPSIMAAGSLLDVAYANHDSPASTLAMVGWQDSDNDGIFDVLDVPHKLSGTGFLDVQAGDYRFQGEASVQTLPNLNPAGLGNDITLNRIREIEYRFDNGPWQLHSSPNVYETSLDLTIPVPTGANQIEIRARDSKTTVVSNVFVGRLERADSTPVPGINGFAWVDENSNGLRDAGEYAPQFWTVELVDSGGETLNLRTEIEPDDFPAGQLEPGFHPGLTLTTNGSDGDGRVGVFADSLTSTGSMSFRGFSRSSRSFQSSWNGETRRLQADFSSPTSIVSIDAVGSGNDTVGRMEAYNSAGQLLDRYTTKVLGSGDVETMTVSRPTADIAYVIIGGHAGSNIKLDYLRFGPETQTVTDVAGGYSFQGLDAGSYNVRVKSSSGFASSDPAAGQQTAIVETNVATTDVDFGFVSTTSDWQNPRDQFDVNDDFVASAIDVLLIINDINENSARDLTGSSTPTPPYIDVSGDSFVSALDVLLVVNFINASGEGEGESPWAGLEGASMLPDLEQFLQEEDEDGHSNRLWEDITAGWNRYAL